MLSINFVVCIDIQQAELVIIKKSRSGERKCDLAAMAPKHTHTHVITASLPAAMK